MLGSKAFVSKHLIPEEIEKRKSKFLGAYVTDMILTFDSKPNSQSMPKKLDWVSWICRLSKSSKTSNSVGNLRAKSLQQNRKERIQRRLRLHLDAKRCGWKVVGDLPKVLRIARIREVQNHCLWRRPACRGRSERKFGHFSEKYLPAKWPCNLLVSWPVECSIA